MGVPRNHAVSFGLVLALACAVPAWAQCTTSVAIVAPIDITTPGCYTLANTITTGATPPTGMGIVISVSDVYLDLSGYAINALTLTRSGIEVSAGLDNITIRNGAINGGFNSVQVLGGSNVVIERLKIFSPSNYAFLIASGTGLVVRDNQIWGGRGIVIGAGFPTIRAATIENNLLENVREGIKIDGAAGVALLGNRVINVTAVAPVVAHGIVVFNSQGFVISGNTVSSIADGNGIHAEGCVDGQIEDNVVNAANGHGISLLTTHNSRLRNNVSGTNTLTGIRVNGDFNSVEGNLLNQNGQSGLWLDGTTGPSQGNTYGRNSVTSSGTLPGACSNVCDPAQICDDGPNNVSFGDNITGAGQC